MKNVFTERRFYVGCEDYLYLWLHMACKSMCEAVVEGMGGVWDRSDRQGNWVTATLEAVIAWNTPKPYHPAAVTFINPFPMPAMAVRALPSDGDAVRGP